mmetsp:Transcript_22293/g.61628  ORF Transcript_22293/g.61628 Transcript_22293/m.61628 type:complete len:93 (-) Transcript_22293:857-1135(-)|eukprot:CAMPEP_0202422694 /NCGR_PEP_ID=MMETSP1128-20130828/50992_1 /ASSEMBLY_ACC=CAM_ASM_000463 /TAXON_ID=3047 /ORGANISM="Dunaliella tertiolecta, Strain CCMP1320" /LENGTH=92 /DNA_ID=CAMNT_0049030767 /DNA_START=128 /DNA_END=406 /DNA_ORIENTATION=-
MIQLTSMSYSLTKAERSDPKAFSTAAFSSLPNLLLMPVALSPSASAPAILEPSVFLWSSPFLTNAEQVSAATPTSASHRDSSSTALLAAALA